MKFNVSKSVSLIGYIISTGVLVSLVPSNYKPLAAVIGSIVTGLLHSPLPPDATTVNEIKTGLQLIDAATVALPTSIQTSAAPLIADVDAVATAAVAPATVAPAVIGSVIGSGTTVPTTATITLPASIQTSAAPPVA